MDHVFRRQGSGSGYSCSSSPNWTVLTDPFVRLQLDDRATGPDDRCCHPATVLKGFIGSIDNGVHLLSRQVTLDHLQHPGIVTMAG